MVLLCLHLLFFLELSPFPLLCVRIPSIQYKFLVLISLLCLTPVLLLQLDVSLPPGSVHLHQDLRYPCIVDLQLSHGGASVCLDGLEEPNILRGGKTHRHSFFASASRLTNPVNIVLKLGKSVPARDHKSSLLLSEIWVS